MFKPISLFPQPVWAPIDDGNPPAGDPTPPPDGNPSAGDPSPATPPAGGDPKWWEGKAFSDDQRTALTANGLTLEDPTEAVAKLIDMETAAQRKLGAKPGELFAKPKEGQDVAEWLRENGDTFGVPKDAEGYEIERPENWPKDAVWNTELEGQARQIAHEEGLSGKALNRMVGLYAENIQQLEQTATEELTAANAEMMKALEADWGEQTTAKMAQAKQAAGVIAEAAGLDAVSVQNISAVLKPQVGDAATIRMFAAIGEMLGEDGLVGLNKGSTTLGVTPADARQKLAALRAPEGAYYKAVQSGNREEIKRLQPEIDNLTKIATGG